MDGSNSVPAEAVEGEVLEPGRTIGQFLDPAAMRIFVTQAREVGTIQVWHGDPSYGRRMCTIEDVLTDRPKSKWDHHFAAANPTSWCQRVEALAVTTWRAASDDGEGES